MASTAASLLPNGEQQFCDANGVPYAGGQVFFYIPQTATLKNTWQDSNQSVLNANPVPLDGAGRAVIYGSGQYRQILVDSLGNTVWDKITSSNLEGSGVFWGGTATGGGNTYNITLGTAATVYYAGMQIAFISDFTNTNATQVVVTNTNGVNMGAVNLYKQTSTGISANTGGEVPLGNIIQAEYDGTQLQIINPVSYTEPAGVIKIYGGTTAPGGYLLCFGQEVSRTTFATLFAAISTNFGIGNGSTTFNIPDLRGNVPAGVDNMGGTPANRITTAGCGINGVAIGTKGGSQSLQLHNHAVTDPTHTHPQNESGGAGGFTGYTIAGGQAWNTTNPGGTGHLTGASSTGITLADAGTGNTQNAQPTIMVTYIIKT